MKNSKTLIIIGVIAVLFFWGCGSYNGLVKQEESVNQVWNNVETQYQRRVDLIPNLVETVKAVADREKGTFTEIAALRSGVKQAQETLKDPSASQADKMKAYGQIDAARSFVMNIQVENYPNLKFPENFSKLQDELAGTENRVMVARNDYNVAVKTYNIAVRKMPIGLLAGILGFDKKEGFKAQAGAENAPKVTF